MNLTFAGIAVDSLQKLIPDRSTRILIYCNNNFTHSEAAFPVKIASASLNIATYVAVYNYGYRNVYELGPLLDFGQSRLEFESSSSR